MARITARFSGTKLREARERAGLLQRDIAARLTKRGIPADQPVISHWESGRNAPLIPTLKVLAEVLGVEIDDLLDEATQVAS